MNKSLVNDPRPKSEHPDPIYWGKIRLKVLKRDCNKCQTCFSELDLEVHHRTYKNFGKEKLDELITLCKDCHLSITTSIRERRYSQQRSISFKNHENKLTIKLNNSYESIEINLKDYRSSSINHAQRPDGGPS